MSDDDCGVSEFTRELVKQVGLLELNLPKHLYSDKRFKALWTALNRLESAEFECRVK